ncbi:MAG: DUF732 domain-containing protein [Mycobacterium sp.]|nr:DUF732 domain-containing protein [Mycobacterium sp.]HKI41610.1 DUF732 domain-containing protein [Mycobacterium sp.]
MNASRRPWNVSESWHVGNLGDVWIAPARNLPATFAATLEDITQSRSYRTGVTNMTTTRIRRPGRLSLMAAGPLAVAALLGPLGAAPTARADATDDAFIAALKAHGIIHESNGSEIAAGHLVCHQLQLGKTQEQIATDVMNSSTLDGDNAGYFVAIAERAYCPGYADIPS